VEKQKKRLTHQSSKKTEKKNERGNLGRKKSGGGGVEERSRQEKIDKTLRGKSAQFVMAKEEGALEEVRR